MSNPDLFLRDPRVPAAEYRKLFGIDKKTYQYRVGQNNERIVSPADALVDADQDKLGKAKAWLSDSGSSAKAKVSDFIDKLKSDRKKSEFSYRQLGKSDDLEMSDLSEPDAEPEEEMGRLPERELMALDQRLQTIEGQISLGLSKLADMTEQIYELENKEDKTPEEITQLQRLKDERDAQTQLVNDLKGDLADNTAKMRKQRNIALGVGGGLAAGGILTGIFEAVANALGSDAAKDLLPKSTDPKDIAESGIGKMILKKLSDLAEYFHEQFLNSTGTIKAFWHMMENSVAFMRDHLWILIASVLALTAYEINKKRK